MQTQSSNQEIYPDHQVFMFCGHIVGDDAANLQSGYVIADTPQYAIENMMGYGFSISAISSLAEIRETMVILELIEERNPEVEPFEYLDLHPEKLARHPDDNVFTFVGRFKNNGLYSKVGFASAASAEDVTKHLQSQQFSVDSITSLADLRKEEARLRLIAFGRPDIDDYNHLNLKLVS